MIRHGKSVFDAKTAHSYNTFSETLPSLTDLPHDVLFLIAQQATPPECLNLCLASRSLKAVCLPHIYCHVDCTASRNILTKQERFIQTMLNHRDYSRYVHSFAWTLVPFYKTLHRKCNPWLVVQRLHNVRSIDITDRSKHDIHAVCLRPVLKLRSITSVRLSGTMDYLLASGIIQTVNLANLVSLTLDNLLDCGKAPVGTIINNTPETLEQIRGWTIEQMRTHTTLWMQQRGTHRWPTVMRNLLHGIAGRCTALKSLTLRKVGQRHKRECCLVRLMEESEILQQWASFVSSVTDTLESFVYEQGVSGQPHTRKWVYPVRLMDEGFGEHMFPVLMGGDWKKLRRMEIRGVRSWRNDVGRLPVVRAEEQYSGRPFNVSIEGQLRAMVGVNVEVMVDEACRVFDDVEMTGR